MIPRAGFGLAVLRINYPDVILAAAFALFTWVYAPVLLSPRMDGKPG